MTRPLLRHAAAGGAVVVVGTSLSLLLVPPALVFLAMVGGGVAGYLHVGGFGGAPTIADLAAVRGSTDAADVANPVRRYSRGVELWRRPAVRTGAKRGGVAGIGAGLFAVLPALAVGWLFVSVPSSGATGGPDALGLAIALAAAGGTLGAAVAAAAIGGVAVGAVSATVE